MKLSLCGQYIEILIAVNVFEIIFQRHFLSAFKGSLSGLKKYLAAKSHLKMMINIFHFMLKALFVLKILKFLSLLFGHTEKRLDEKLKLILEILGNMYIVIVCFPDCDVINYQIVIS